MRRLAYRWFKIIRPLRLLAATLVGAGIGYGLFLISSLGGQDRFISGGALVGLGFALLSSLLRGRFEEIALAEVQLSVPQFSQLKFLVNAEYRRVAWKLFVETSTRIATQPLNSEDGFLREALDSLHGLFQTTRQLLKGMEPSRHTGGDEWSVEMFAMSMLNDEIRPFLAKWHPLLTAFEKTTKDEAQWERNEDCRAELEQVRQQLLVYARGFGELAGVTNLDHFIEKPSSNTARPSRELSN